MDASRLDVDLHIHTKYSADSILEPKTIIKLAMRRGLSVIAVTDHNTIRGSLATIRESLHFQDFTVIPGIEVRTDLGDLIGLFVQEQIEPGDFKSVAEKIVSQGGLAVLPHPYTRHIVTKELLKSVDIMEVMNGRSSHSKNTKAKKIALELGKPAIAGSDSHFSFEIGRVRTRFFRRPSNFEEFRKLILGGRREFIGRESTFVVHGLSFATETLRRVMDFL